MRSIHVLSVMDHKEYDKKDDRGKQRWIDARRCDNPPPPRP